MKNKKTTRKNRKGKTKIKKCKKKQTMNNKN